MQEKDNTTFIGCSHPEWGRMWAALGGVEGDIACDCPCCHEFWQYVGSFAPVGSEQWQHTFRHRHHPKTSARRYINTPASVEFDQEMKGQRIPKGWEQIEAGKEVV